jgi:hypothetical protein
VLDLLVILRFEVSTIAHIFPHIHQSQLHLIPARFPSPDQIHAESRNIFKCLQEILVPNLFLFYSLAFPVFLEVVDDVAYIDRTGRYCHMDSAKLLYVIECSSTAFSAVNRAQEHWCTYRELDLALKRRYVQGWWARKLEWYESYKKHLKTVKKGEERWNPNVRVPKLSSLPLYCTGPPIDLHKIVQPSLIQEMKIKH